MTKKIEKIDDLVPDPNNANKGTLRGLAMLEDSLQENGAGRSVLADKNGVLIAGNKTVERALELGMDIVVVPTDGKKLVVVQRTDLDLNKDKRARQLATADNRVAQVDLDWDIEALLKDAEAGQLDIHKAFDQDEIATMLAAVQEPYTPVTDPKIGTVKVDDDDVTAAAKKLGDKFAGNKNYVKVICPHCAQEFYLDKKDVK